MLREIHINGLAIIDQSLIEFGPGLNIITGETGAGKSIMIKALNLLLGAKSDTTMIRSGRDKATVSAEFEVQPNSPIYQKAIELGVIERSDSPCLLMRRVLHKNGRSKAWINDQPVTLQAMKSISEELLDLFSQHESHHMLNAKYHLDYLDEFIKKKNVTTDYADLYKKTHEQLRSLRENLSGLKKLKQEEDYLSFRVREFNELSPEISDFEELYSKIDQLENNHTHAEWLAEALQILDSSEELQHGLQRVEKLAHNLASANDKYKEFSDLAKSALEALNELSYGSARLNSEDTELDESELENIRERISKYKDLMRKTGSDSVAELVTKHAELVQQIESISELEATVRHQLADILKASKNLSKAAKLQKSEREKAAANVRKSLETELKSLVMPNAKVDVEFSPVSNVLHLEEYSLLSEQDQDVITEIAETLTSLGSQGSEQAQFLLSANPGEKLRPLQKVVSGGELSRIMLALKKALSAGARTCVLVFDEIDTGISGQIADVVGNKLKSLSKKFQIICISHLPQVAVYADEHFLVSKHQTKSKTETSFLKLDSKHREKEIARLLSGPELTASSLSNARSLLKKAR